MEAYKMSNTLGKAVRVTLFGESHGPAVGAVIDGLPSGIRIDLDYIKEELTKRSAQGGISTGRKEPDIPEFLSGIKDVFTEGTPVALIIRNTNIKASDYEQISHLARPSHADYTAEVKYQGFQDASGGGHFSGRVSAPLVAAGAILKCALEEKGIFIGTHISSLHGISDRKLSFPSKENGFRTDDLKKDISQLNKSIFPVLDDDIAKEMTNEILSAKEDQDSVGGILETAVAGLEAGIGEPWFSSFESELSAALFAVPAVKGVEFGAGFSISSMLGSEANDQFATEGGRVFTTSNNNGGINGGITNGMPVVFRTAVKPTPSISKQQNTIDIKTKENAQISINGRHDPAIVHRARAVVDAVTAIVISDLIARRHGYLALRSSK